MRRSPMSSRRRRIRIALTAAVVAVIAVPAVAATCYDMTSSGIGGSGMFGGQRTMIELGKGEIGGIDCKGNKIKQVLNSTSGVLFTCE